MKKQPEITIHMPEDLLKKFLFVAQAENRSPSAQFSFMVRNNIAYYEKTKGRITDAQLKDIDVSEYLPKE